MSDELKEVVGFLCRWGLLGLVGVALVTAAALCLATAAAATFDLTATLVLPDALSLEPGDVRMDGYLGTRLYDRGPAVLFRTPSTDRLFLAPGWKNRFFVLIDGPRPGLTPIELVGVPYGPFAFTAQTALLLNVPAPDRVFLIDARVAAVAFDSPRWRRSLNRLRHRGEVVFFVPGPLAEFTALRRLLRRRFADIPVVLGIPVKRDNLPTIERTVRTYYRSGVERTFLITADEPLARLVAERIKRWASVHLLASPGREGISSEGALTIHHSWEDLVQQLAGG